jgi:prolyl-tRNA editing enzyme YbaK/EbsC (Cys-tRNA(Pro) deacylase)
MDVSCNLKIPLENIIKCLIFETNQNISIAAIIPGTEKLSIKKLGYASGLKKTRLMSPDRIKIITGSELGGISPINVAPIMQTFADIKLLTTSYICGSAGSPFHMLKMNPIDLVKFGIFYVDISI